MKILITGGAGFIGSHLAEYLISKNQQVIILDDFSGSQNSNLKGIARKNLVEVVNGSTLDEDLVRRIMKSVDKCFHLAASLGVARINLDPVNCFKANIAGSEIILKMAAEYNVKTLLASSSEIYGKNPVMPLLENSDRVLGSPEIARWSYSEAKAIDELHAMELYKHNSLRVTIARFFNTVGPRQSGSYGMVLPRFIRAAIINDPLIVYGNGTQSRTFCSVSDVVDALALLMDSSESLGQAFNIGSTNEISILELAHKVIKITNSTSKIVYKDYSEVFGDHFEEPQRRVPDISKIRNAVGWQPTISLDEVVIEIVKYLKANDT